jgi:beta-1,4-mannosyltransferase
MNLPPAGQGLQAQPLRVVMYDTLSGTNDYANELIEALSQQAGLDLTVVTVESSRLPADVACKVWRLMPDFGAPESAHVKAAKLARAYVALVRAALVRPRSTILHVQFFKFAWLEAPLFLALRLLGVRVVFTAHNALPHVRKRWHQAFYRWWYQQADAVHVLSDSVARDIRDTVGARPQAIHRIAHGPYLGLKRRFGPRMDAVESRRRLGIEPGEFVVLQYGLFRDYKGLDVLMQALCRLPPQAPVRLLLAGGGYPTELAAWRAIAEQGQRSRQVTWLDRFVSDAELCDCIAAADLVVFPYRRVSQSGALYLALTFEKPCVASDLPGFRESLPDEPDAFFPAGDAQALAQRIVDLQQEPQRLRALQRRIANHALEHFDWQLIAQSMVAMYLGLRDHSAD